MRKFVKTSALSIALVGSLGFASALLAHESGSATDSGRSMMGRGMTGGGMMNMMGQMSGMMDHCSQMMQGGANKPNEQWRKDAPAEPNRKG
jgi:hypothetical protein